MYKELQDRLNNIYELEFAEKHKFEILRERIFQEYNVCPDCGGSGNIKESFDHYETFKECHRCKGLKVYIDKGLMKYFGYFM